MAALTDTTATLRDLATQIPNIKVTDITHAVLWIASIYLGCAIVAGLVVFAIIWRATR